MRITNTLAAFFRDIHGHLAATLPPNPPPGSLGKPLVQRMICAAMVAPRCAAEDRVAVLRTLAPPLVNDVLFLVADQLETEGMVAVEAANYDRSSAALRETRLRIYAQRIGLRDKPAAMGWTQYVTQLYARNAQDLDRDRALLDVAVGALTPTKAVTLFPDDEDMVTMAVKLHGCALELASPRLQANPHVATVAVYQHGHAMRWAHSTLTRDKTLGLRAVSTHPYAYMYLDTSLQTDTDIARRTLQRGRYMRPLVRDRYPGDISGFISPDARFLL